MVLRDLGQDVTQIILHPEVPRGDGVARDLGEVAPDYSMPPISERPPTPEVDESGDCGRYHAPQARRQAGPRDGERYERYERYDNFTRWHSLRRQRVSG